MNNRGAHLVPPLVGSFRIGEGFSDSLVDVKLFVLLKVEHLLRSLLDELQDLPMYHRSCVWATLVSGKQKLYTVTLMT